MEGKTTVPQQGLAGEKRAAQQERKERKEESSPEDLPSSAAFCQGNSCLASFCLSQPCSGTQGKPFPPPTRDAPGAVPGAERMLRSALPCLCGCCCCCDAFGRVVGRCACPGTPPPGRGAPRVGRNPFPRRSPCGCVSLFTGLCLVIWAPCRDRGAFPAPRLQPRVRSCVAQAALHPRVSCARLGPVTYVTNLSTALGMFVHLSLCFGVARARPCPACGLALRPCPSLGDPNHVR